MISSSSLQYSFAILKVLERERASWLLYRIDLRASFSLLAREQSERDRASEITKSWKKSSEKKSKAALLTARERPFYPINTDRPVFDPSPDNQWNTERTRRIGKRHSPKLSGFELNCESGSRLSLNFGRSRNIEDQFGNL